VRAVVYARYSSDLQRTESIEDQIRICRERIVREGWTYLHAYHDRAMSGASLLRPGYQKLIDDAQHGMFDVVVAEALDRLSRDQEHVAHLFKRLAFLGIKIATVSEGLITELHVGLSGTIGALYLKQLAEKTHRGLRGRVEKGRSGGGNSYGYDVVRTPAQEDKSELGLRSINACEAEIVREIFRTYANGASPRSIAKSLNSRGIDGPSGGSWGPSTINGNAARGTGILNNELYVGRLVWNRLKYMKNPETGRRQSRLNPRETWIISDVPELRIVPQELWDEVKNQQAKMARATRPDRKQSGFWNAQRPRSLLSGLLKCATCGASYTKFGANRFACARARDRATCTNRLTVRGDQIEQAILDCLKSRLMEPALFEEFTREFIAEINRVRSEASSVRGAMRRELERLDRQIKRLVDAILNGADATSINAKLNELEAERSRLATELALSSNDEPLLHPNVASIYRARVEALSDLLRSDADREAIELLRCIIEEVRVIPQDDGAYRLEVRGELGGILALSQGAKNSGSTAAQRALQIKLVAGARNSRHSHRIPALFKLVA